MMPEFTYTVTGKWPFPADMLRRDDSRGATDEDRALIERYSGEFSPDEGDLKTVEIRLIGNYRPNAARWESFGWSYLSDDPLDRPMPDPSEEYVKLVAQAGRKLTKEQRKAIEWMAGRQIFGVELDN